MEEKKASSKAKYIYFGAVIDAPKKSPSIQAVLRGYEALLQNNLEFVFLATIIHDKDLYTKEDERLHAERKEGTHKRDHLHAFFSLGEGMTQGQCLKWLEGALKCDREQISLTGSNSEILLCQYLTHQNHPEKAQYSADEITSNNREKLEEILKTSYEPPKDTGDEMQQAVLNCLTYVELVQQIGLEKANKYRASFNQIKTEQRQNYEAIYRAYDVLKQDFKTLWLEAFKITSRAQRSCLDVETINEVKATLEGLQIYYAEMLDEIEPND